MSKPTYAELLKHPKWQKRRLEIMERSKVTGDHCRETEDTLNVHHGMYLKGKKPWEYPDELLHCLCENCHKAMGEELQAVHYKIGTQSLAMLRQIRSILEAEDSIDSPKQLRESFIMFCDYAGISAYPLVDLVGDIIDAMRWKASINKRHPDNIGDFDF